MKQYIFSIILVSVIASVVSIIAPEGEGGGISRHVSLAVGVSLVLVCFAPAVQAVEWLRELDIEAVLPNGEDEREEYESIFNSTYTDAEVDNLCEGIKSLVSQKYGLDPLSFTVSVRLTKNGQDKRPERITLTLYGSAIWADTGEIERYLGSLFGCEIVTIIG